MTTRRISPTYALLGLLFQSDRHGYDLKRQVDQDFAPFWRIDFAQLYRSLAKMKHAGWVKPRTVRGQDAPNRQVYSITALGRRAFQAWIAEPAKSRDEFFVKVRLANEHGFAVSHLGEEWHQALENEHAKRADRHSAAQRAGNAGQLIVAHAALRETEASLTALDLYQAVAPGKRGVANVSARPLVITGSDDPLLARLAKLVHTATHSVGSIGGLLALSQHQADIAGVHLLDTETGEYNIPFIKHLLPEENIVLVNLALRENGLMLARGNPKNIRGVRDLTRHDVRFINRARGTGTRLLLFSKLRRARIDPHTLSDWEHAVATHDAVAAAIATGAADVGPGLRATACEWNLDFIPLGEERYDLAIPRAEFESARLETVLAKLHSQELRRAAETLAGYDLTRSGNIITRLK